MHARLVPASRAERVYIYAAALVRGLSRVGAHFGGHQVRSKPLQMTVWRHGWMDVPPRPTDGWAVVVALHRTLWVVQQPPLLEYSDFNF